MHVVAERRKCPLSILRRHLAHRFGLGAPTGITLEHESGGIIPSSAWKRQRFGEPWYAGETLSVAIGQGYVTSTPLQMASVIAAVAPRQRALATAEFTKMLSLYLEAKFR